MLSNNDSTVNQYVSQILASQDLLATDIQFPLDRTQVLLPQDYVDYFVRMSKALAARKHRAATLTLTCGNSRAALQGLLAYVATKAPLFFNEVAIQFAEPMDEEQFLVEFTPVLRALSAAGLSAVQLVAEKSSLTPAAIARLTTLVKTTPELTTDLILPPQPENAENQQEIDALVSIQQRARRIAEFGKEVQHFAASGEGEFKGKVKKRVRAKAKQQLAIDIEVQVEVAIEPAVEKVLAEQFEDKVDKEFIDRDEFIRRAQAAAFKGVDYEALQGHEKRIWDHWFGNISQWVVGPLKVQRDFFENQRAGIDLLVMSAPPTADTDFSAAKNVNVFVLEQATPGTKPTALWYVNKKTAKPTVQQVDFAKAFQEKATLQHFLKKCWPKVNNYIYNNQLDFHLTDNHIAIQLENLTGIVLWGWIQVLVSKWVEDKEELWKGKTIHDATTVPENDQAITALKTKCPVPLKNPEVQPALYLNPHYQRLTSTACEKLLQHHAQFQYGLDFKHLTAGFELLKVMLDGKETQVLDYHPRKARIAKQDSLAIQLFTPPEAKPLSQQLFQHWLDSTPKVGVDLWLQNKYQEFLQPYYQRKRIDQFKQYLPVLLAMPQAALDAAGKDLESLIKAARHHQKGLSKVPADFTQHLLLRVLAPDSRLRETLQQWHVKLQLTSADLNGLLTVYDAYGDQGLEKLFAAWEKVDSASFPDLLQQLHTHYFSHLTTYLPLMETAYQDAVNILQRLSKAEQAWWQALFAQHAAAVGADNLLALVKAFQAFSEAIKNKKLDFYPDCKFHGIKSLPVALSRMLEIINNTSPADLALVWQGITELDLQSNGAIRLLNDSPAQSTKGVLVVPEMQAQPHLYFPRHDDYPQSQKEQPQHGYQAMQNSHKDPAAKKTLRESLDLVRSPSYDSPHHLIAESLTPSELKRNYYRYLSAQTNRLSLGFYRKAGEIIDQKLADSLLRDNLHLRHSMYAMLAAATSGFDALLCLDNEEASLKQISDICDAVNGISFPVILPIPDHFLREAMFTDSFLKLNPVPPLPYFKKMMDIARQAFTVSTTDLCSIISLKKRILETEGFFDQISAVSRVHKFAFYEGLHCVGKDAIQLSKERFFDLVSVASIINFSAYQKPVPTELKITKVQGSLLRLMSTFDLQPDIFESTTEIEKNPSKCQPGRIYVKLGSSEVFTYIAAGMNKAERVTFSDLVKNCDEGLTLGSLRRHQNLLWEHAHAKGYLQSSDLLRSKMREQRLLNASDNFLDALYCGLTLLSKMEDNLSRTSNTPFTEKELMDFWDALETEVKAADPNQAFDADQLAIKIVKNQFEQNFKPNFFESLRGAPLSVDVEKIIESFELNEREVVRLILISFKRVTDQYQRPDAVKSLLYFGAKLPPLTRMQFLKDLSTVNSAGDNELVELNLLLTEIGNRGNIDDFNYLLACAKKENTTALITKLIIFYQHAVPFIHAKDRNQKLAILDLQPLAARLLLNTSMTANRFKEFFDRVMAKLEQLVERYPQEKQVLLALLDSALSHFIKASAGDIAQLFETFLDLLDINPTKDVQSADLFRALASHFNKKPEDLYDILTAVKGYAIADKKFVLEALTCLLNNGRECKLAVFQEFLALYQTNPAFKAEVASFFTSPPYPTFEQILEWHKAAEKNAAAAPMLTYQEQLAVAYQAYNLKPCEREQENGFHLWEARELAAQFKGMTQPFTESELSDFEQQTKAIQSTGCAALQTELVELKKKVKQRDLTLVEKCRLLAVIAELLHRSKGGAGGKGKSYELNTLQYLTVLSFLKSNGHMTGEMATGLGKSRAGMIAIGCLQALGKTVDFVTSDLYLAQRDYLEYQAFFRMLDPNVKTQLITESSAADSYAVGGIHFSDATNLSLFRNKAKSSREGHKVILADEHKQDRALFLDEADRTYFDVSETRYNYSTKANDNIKGMEWIYPILVRFFNQADEKECQRVRDLFANDMDACNSEFINFLKAEPEYRPEMLDSIHLISQGQLEAWQEAAVTALDLKLGSDYTLEPNVLINTPQGPKLATEARLIYGHCLSKTSKFSFGVHQCLHAYLNDELRKPHSATSQKCRQQLQSQKREDAIIQPFYIHPEKEIVYSSTSKSLLDDYQAGQVWAVTGSAGALIERQEAAALYGKDSATARQAMEFVTIPRKEVLRRVNQPFHLTGNFKQKVAALLEDILEAQATNRPVLVICENDKAAEELNQALRAAFEKAVTKLPEAQQLLKRQILPDRWQFVDSATSIEDEEKKIKNAGQSNYVTIGTPRLGRGRDIQVAVDEGLRVRATFFPRERDQIQIFGRASRYGAKGDVGLIVDREELAQQLGKKKLDVDFFLANEFYVKSQQSRMDREKQIDRLIRNSLSDFRMKITDAFFKYYDALKEGVGDKEDEEKLLAWSDFSKQVDQLWNQAWPDLVSLASQPTIDMHRVKDRLARFKSAAQKKWDDLRSALGIKAGSSEQLPEKLEKLELDPRTEHLMRTMMPKRKYTMADRTKVYETYNKALDGRAAIYEELFADWKAVWRGERKLFANTRAWWAGHGLLFADTRAWWAGKRPLFATLRAWLYKNALPPLPEPLKTQDIMEALAQHNEKDVQHFVREMDVPQFLEPLKGDILLSFKIQLVEAVLDFAHDRITKGQRITHKDMDDMKAVLSAVKAEQSTSQQQLVSSVTQKLQHTTVRFFGRSLKPELKKIIDQRQQEHELDTAAVNQGQLGWQGFDLGSIAPAV